jgi:ribose transport system substrate-binding protein
MKSKQILAVAWLAAIALVAAGCQQPYHQQDEKYILVAANVGLPYWQEAQAGLNDIAKTAGVKVDVMGPASFSPNEELDAFKQAVAAKPSGILVSVTDPKAFKEPIDSALMAGIPVICLDADAPDSRRVLFIGTDNFRAGQDSGKRMADLLGGQGRVVVIGLGGQLNTEQRARGVDETLKRYPGVKITQSIDGKGDPRVTFDAISALLQKKDRWNHCAGSDRWRWSSGCLAPPGHDRKDKNRRL